MKREHTSTPAKSSGLTRATTQGKKSSKQQHEEMSETDRDTNIWASVKPFAPSSPKAQLTIRLDQDIVDWFRGLGRGYQTHINSALRSYVEHASAQQTARRVK